MEVNFEILESQLSETEMALLMAVNVALNAGLIAGADARVNLLHLKQHEDNFAKLGKQKAQHILAAVQLMHKAAAGIK
jgi:hypothetical protein